MFFTQILKFILTIIRWCHERLSIKLPYYFENMIEKKKRKHEINLNLKMFPGDTKALFSVLNIRTQARTHKHTHTRTHTHALTNIHTHTHTRARAHTHTHARTHTHRSDMQTLERTQINTCILTHIYTLTWYDRLIVTA